MECQVCGCTEFEEGPGTGASCNVRCARCGAKHNVTPFGVELLSFAQKPKVKIHGTDEVIEFSTTKEAMDWVKARPDSRPFGHKYLVYSEDNVLVLDG